eukprot:TRINITY_DN16840_c0_g1_i1.p1 TRINITY_DN16840_c0_g1~~TRINITY_DN16840_c0_g1_i1.p1  ORF type:complete len:585 (-),score=130.40 TRINITY_DN16840_c0_g1_i1:109-1863(-)
MGQSCYLAPRATLPVDLQRADQTRSWWQQKVDPSLVLELLLSDGKALADFHVFLRDLAHPPEEVIETWLLTTARFALTWEPGELKLTTKLAEKLRTTWDAYLHAPTGFGNFRDIEEWKVASVQAGVGMRRDTTMIHDSLVKGNLIDERHKLYSFATCMMVGIQVAVVCSTIIDNCLTKAIEGSGQMLRQRWSASFPGLNLMQCLQNSSLRYVIPPEGTAYSPPLTQLTKGRVDTPFSIEDFCPELFAQIRHLVGVSNESYYMSACRPDAEYVQIGTNSCSGEFFFFTQDGKYLLKTTTVKEAEMLTKMLPDMIARFKDCPRSLLGRYVGLYRITSEEMDIDKMFFVMMAATQHSLPIFYGYDMKGSTRGRRAKPGDHIRKDLDFLDDFGELNLHPDVAQQLRDIHEADVKILEKHQIMDYSVLMDVHEVTASEGKKEFERMGSDKALIPLGNAKLNSSSNWGRIVTDTCQKRASSKAPPSEAGWHPSYGIPSADGQYIFTMAIIDMLVPFNWWYPKAQVAGQYVISCGADQGYSRQRPERYARTGPRRATAAEAAVPTEYPPRLSSTLPEVQKPSCMGSQPAQH